MQQGTTSDMMHATRGRHRRPVLAGLVLLAGAAAGQRHVPHEEGRMCIDKIDNDGDQLVDCDDADCAAVCNLLGAYGHTFADWRKSHARVDWDPNDGVDPRTCFEPGGKFTRRRCCNTYKGRFPKGNPRCWGGGYSFKLCCGDGKPHEEPWQCRDGVDNDKDGTVDCADSDCGREFSCTDAYWDRPSLDDPPPKSGTPDANLRELCTNAKLGEVTSTAKNLCPKPDRSHLVPTHCPVRCAKSFAPWYDACRLTTVAKKANAVLHNGLEHFAQKCATKLLWSKRHQGTGELCVYGGCSAHERKSGTCLACAHGLMCTRVKSQLCELWTGGGKCPGVCSPRNKKRGSKKQKNGG